MAHPHILGAPSHISRGMPLIPWQLHQTPIGPSMAPGVIAVLCEVDATNKGHGAVEDDGFDVRQIEDLGIKLGFLR